ncbi:MATE family efflux transporter [Treponema sp.]|uniref:MATE family efflux transporter n=1 Tax=Treponema sp. TaxID=166 RepID=UPI00388EC12D
MYLSKNKTVDMTYGAILPHIISFAIPLLLGNLFQQLYNTADCLVVGKFLGRDSLAAIGSTSHLVMTVIGFFGGFSTGAQIVISQCFGAKKTADLRKSVHTALASSAFISLFMTLLGLFTSPLMLRLIHVPEEVFELADSYLKIYFSGVSFLIFYNMGSGILRALGDSRRPLYFLIFSSVVNIILDLIFVVVLKFGVKGAAWATVISEAISIIPVFCSLIFTGEIYKVSFREFKIDFPLLSKMLKIGLPGAVSSSITSFSNTFMQKYVNVFGSSCIAGWAVFGRFDQFRIMLMTSISFAATTFVAQNFGAGEKERIKKGIKISLLVSLSVAVFLSTLEFIFADFFTSIFISDADSIHFGSLFIRYTTPFYLPCVICMLFSQILRGFGDSLVPTIITFSGFVLLRQMILFFGTKLTDSFSLVALAYPVVWIFTGTMMLVYYRYKVRLIQFSDNFNRKIL